MRAHAFTSTLPWAVARGWWLRFGGIGGAVLGARGVKAGCRGAHPRRGAQTGEGANSARCCKAAKTNAGAESRKTPLA